MSKKRDKLISIESESEAYNAALYISEFAKQYGFNIDACQEIKMAVSEIAINAYRYGKNAVIELDILNKNKILKIKVIDQGPGISDIDHFIRKGVSSRKTSLGIGLDVARRNMDTFHIDSDQNGTIVEMQKFLPIPDEKVTYGVLSLQDPNYAVNGDKYVIREYDGDKALLAVIDGLGQGETANKASSIVKNIIAKAYPFALNELVEETHKRVKEQLDNQSGFTINIAKVQRGNIEYTGIGDTFCLYYDHQGVKKLRNKKGILGSNLPLPSFQISNHKPAKEFLLMLCSDGIKESVCHSEISLDQTVDQLTSHVFRQFRRDYGDATVLIGRFKNL